MVMKEVDLILLVSKCADKCITKYFIEYKTAAELLCMALLELVIRERFDSKHLRLFRLLVLKKYLEQKEIISMALISHKEANKMLYSLLAEQYVTLQVHCSVYVLCHF